MSGFASGNRRGPLRALVCPPVCAGLRPLALLLATFAVATREVRLTSTSSVPLAHGAVIRRRLGERAKIGSEHTLPLVGYALKSTRVEPPNALTMSPRPRRKRCGQNSAYGAPRSGRHRLYRQEGPGHVPAGGPRRRPRRRVADKLLGLGVGQPWGPTATPEPSDHQSPPIHDAMMTRASSSFPGAQHLASFQAWARRVLLQGIRAHLALR